MKFLAIIFSYFLSTQALAEVPVVDESENFAILNEQQAAFEQPVAKAQIDYVDPEENIALVREENTVTQQGNAELLNTIKNMQQEIQELRGQLDVQSHELKLLKEQQLAFYKDLDTRLASNTGRAEGLQAKLKTPASTTYNENSLEQEKISPMAAPPLMTKQTTEMPVSTTAAIQVRKNPADEQISYLAAYDLVKTKRFDEAMTAMQDFVAKYPKGGYTANAEYWLGELHMVKKDYPAAIKHFEIVLKYFPTSSKAAASALKIGYALASSGKHEEARERLLQVVQNFPDTPTAQLASTKLRNVQGKL